MSSFANKLAKMQQAAQNENKDEQAQEKQNPATDVPAERGADEHTAAPAKASKPTVVATATAAGKQKYSIYLTDGEREFMDEYKFANRKNKVASDGTLKNMTYTDIVSEALALFAKEHGYTIKES